MMLGSYRKDTSDTWRIYDAELNIGLSVEKEPFVYWTVGIVMGAVDHVAVAVLRLGMN